MSKRSTRNRNTITLNRIMQRKIRHILQENRKHPERCISLRPAVSQPNGNGIVPFETIKTLMEYMLEHGEPL